MKNKGLKTVLILFGTNLFYYLAYGIFLYYELSELEGIGMSMLYWALGIWTMECCVLLVGYILLFLRLRIGQIVLILFYILKTYVYIISLSIESLADIRFVVEIIFYLVVLITLICSKNVNCYIKSKWKKKRDL